MDLNLTPTERARRRGQLQRAAQGDIPVKAATASSQVMQVTSVNGVLVQDPESLYNEAEGAHSARSETRASTQNPISMDAWYQF